MKEDELRKSFKKELRDGSTFRKIASRFTTITFGDVFRIVNDGVFPVGDDKRLELGLSLVRPAPVCPTHGIVHVGTCPGKKRKPTRKDHRDLFSLPSEELAEMIRNRQPVGGQDG